MFKLLKFRPGVPLCNRSYHRHRIGNREIVGHGCNGQIAYKDDVLFPFPAIRFREPDSEISNLKQKELGDWKQLSIEEKKALYRASFCQTFSEFMAPTGQWKFTLGMVFILMSGGCGLFIITRLLVYEALPESCSLENRQAQLRRMIDLHVNPIDGLSSKWDYEHDRWKVLHNIFRDPNQPLLFLVHPADLQTRFWLTTVEIFGGGLCPAVDIFVEAYVQL